MVLKSFSWFLDMSCQKLPVPSGTNNCWVSNRTYAEKTEDSVKTERNGSHRKMTVEWKRNVNFLLAPVTVYTKAVISSGIDTGKRTLFCTQAIFSILSIGLKVVDLNVRLELEPLANLFHPEKQVIEVTLNLWFWESENISRWKTNRNF